MLLSSLLSCLFLPICFSCSNQDGYRGNVTLYIKSENSEIDGQFLYTVGNHDGFNRLFIGDYIDPKSTFYLVKSYIYQQLTGSKTKYDVTYNSDGYLGVSSDSDGVTITDYNTQTGKLQFSNDELLYAVHVVDNPNGYSASQYAIKFIAQALLQKLIQD